MVTSCAALTDLRGLEEHGQLAVRRPAAGVRRHQRVHRQSRPQGQPQFHSQLPVCGCAAP